MPSQGQVLEESFERQMQRSGAGGIVSHPRIVCVCLYWLLFDLRTLDFFFFLQLAYVIVNH